MPGMTGEEATSKEGREVLRLPRNRGAAPSRQVERAGTVGEARGVFADSTSLGAGGQRRGTDTP